MVVAGAYARDALPDRRWVYPEEHLATIGPFILGDQCDPRGAFSLNSDMWDAWPYAANAREALRYQTRLRFNRLGSFLRPYAKWFCYERLQAGTSPRTLCRSLSMLGVPGHANVVLVRVSCSKFA